MSQKRIQKRERAAVSPRERPRVPAEYKDLVQATRLANLPAADSVARALRRLDQQVDWLRTLFETAKPGETVEAIVAADSLCAAKRDALCAPIWAAACAAFPCESGVIVIPRYGSAGFPIQFPTQLAYAVADTQQALLAMINARRRGRTYVDLGLLRVDLSTAEEKSFSLDYLLPAIRGRDLKKLARCPRKRCMKFFVKERQDQRGCCAKCSNALRQHGKKPFETIEDTRDPILEGI